MNIAPLFLCCQLAALGLLRKTQEYSFFEEAITGFPLWGLWVARIVSAAVFVTVAIAASHFCRISRSRAFLLCIAAALGIGLSITFFAAMTFELFVFGQVLVGIAHALALMCWGAVYNVLDRRTRNRDIAVSAVATVALWTFMGIVPEEISPFVYLAISLVSVLALLAFSGSSPNHGSRADVLSKHQGLASDAKGIFEMVPWELVVLMASYSLFYRLLGAFDYSAELGSVQVFYGCAVRLGGMILLLVYLTRMNFEPNLKQMIVPLFFLTVMGLCTMLASDESLKAMSVALSESSWTFFYTLMWLFLFEYGRLCRGGEFPTFASGWAIMNVLLLLAAPVAVFLQHQVSQGVLSMLALVLVVIYTLSVAIMVFRRAVSMGQRSSGSAEGEEQARDGASDRMGDALRIIGDECGLTKKEREVFALLARGWTLPAIEEEMVLSHSTIKGHARHIYRKLGVASKQELIEFVESRIM